MHKTTWEEKGILWEFTGILTFEEADEANGEMYGDSRFDNIQYFIWDLTHAKGIAMSEEDVRHTAATDKGSSYSKKNIKGALVTNDQQVRQVMNSYIKESRVLNTTWELKLFNSASEARSWLSF